jgi:O-antigen/teichoic acid export membrane protein
LTSDEQRPDAREAEPSASAGATTRRVAGNTIALAAGDIATKLGLFVLYAVIARELGEGGFGDYTLAISLAFFVRIAGLGIDLILSREVARDVDKVHGLFWEAINLKVIAGTPVLAGTVVFAIAGGYDESVVLAVLLIGVSILIDELGLSAHSVLKGTEQMGPTAKALMVKSLVLVSLGSAGLLLLEPSLVVLGVVYVISALAGLAYITYAMWGLGIQPRRVGDTEGLAWLFRAAIPTGIATVLGTALGRLDAVILSVITDDAVAVGLYGGAYRLFEATLFVSWSFGIAVYPMLSRQRGGSRDLRRTFEISCLGLAAVTVPMAGSLFFFGPAILETLFGSGFGAGGTAARILGGAALFYGLFAVPALTLAGQDRQDLFPWISGWALVVNVALNFALIPPLGIEGAAIAMVVAQGLATAMSMWFALRETGRVSPIRMFAASLAGLLAMGAVMLLLGGGLGSLFVALLAFAIVFFVVEWTLHREDLYSFVAAFRQGAAGTDAAAGTP